MAICHQQNISALNAMQKAARYASMPHLSFALQTLLLSFSVPLNLPCLAGLGEGEYNTPENVKLWESPGKAGGLPLIIRFTWKDHE